MTKDEALDLALEALELNNSEWKSLADSGDCGYWNAEDQDHYKQTNEAITAIKQARLAPVQECFWKREGYKECPAAQPAPVQEPVCHICGGTGEMDSGGTLPWGEAINIPCECTAPPAAQRQWVGLTAAERKEIERLSVYVEGAIRFTEAKLKEKNT